MKLKMWLAVATPAIAVGLAGEPAGAAPAGAALTATVAAPARSGSVRQAGWDGRGRRHYYAPRYRYLDWKHRYFRQAFRSYFAPGFQPMFRRL
jgi:hypothetical protein